MLSTYYIYYIVTTYYVVNGITIIDYLHNDNSHNSGNAWYIATVCPIVKGVYCVCAPCYRATRRYLYATGLGNGFGNAHALTLYALAVIVWVWDSFGVCPFPCSPQKKYVFSGMLNFVGEPDRRYPHRVESRWLASSCQFPLMGLMPCPCGGAFFCLYCPTWIGGCK
jgi:hypothetical protein